MSYDTNDFEEEVIERSHTVPVLVDFWAAWCGPCLVLGPVLEKLAETSGSRWALAKLDTESFPEISARYGIRSIPNVKLFVDGEVKDEFVGALPEPQVVEWLRKALPSKYRVQLESARQLLSENRSSEARDLLRQVVAAESDNETAVVMLARTFLGDDPQQAAETVESIGLGSEKFEEAGAIKTLSNVFSGTEVQDTLPQDPVKELYLSAIGKARSSDFTGALDGFIDVVAKNRYYDDDGSREACVAILKLMEDDDRETKSYRQALNSALY